MAANAANAASASGPAAAKSAADPLKRLRHNMQKMRAVGKVAGRQRRMSAMSREKIKANRDMRNGYPGLYRSCRPVHAFDVDCEIQLEKNWGQQKAAPGDFIVVGEPKASTDWRSDVYTVPRTEFLADFVGVPGAFHEFQRAGTMYASTQTVDAAYKTAAVNGQTKDTKILQDHCAPEDDGKGNTSGGHVKWSPEKQWLVKKSSSGQSLRSDGEKTVMRHSLFSEAFEPVFVEHPDAHIVMMEFINIMKLRDPLAEAKTLAFKGANTLFVLQPGDLGLVTSGQFKVGRMGSKPEDEDGFNVFKPPSHYVSIRT